MSNELLHGGIGKNNTHHSRYGELAAKRFQKILRKNPERAAECDVMYAQPSQGNWLQDTFQYAKQDIRYFGKRDRDYLNFKDLYRAFGPAVASQFMKAIDTNGDNKISRTELAAYILLQDHPDLVLDTMETFAEQPESQLFSSEDRNQLKEMVQSFKERFTPSKADGIVTSQERDKALALTLAGPNFVKMVLQNIQETLFAGKGSS